MARAAVAPVYTEVPSMGIDGRTVLAGARAPLMTDGRVGDFWVDTAAKKLYGPKNAASWPDNGLIKGDKGWVPVLGLSNDGTRRVFRVIDWTGGEGTKPTTGQYVGATGLVNAIGDGVDVRGAAGPEALINALTAKSTATTYKSLVAIGEAAEDNRKATLDTVFAPGGKLTFKTLTAAQAENVPVTISHAEILSLGVTRKRVNSEPVSGGKHRSTDRFTADGGTDSANGGWWADDADLLNMTTLRFYTKTEIDERNQIALSRFRKAGDAHIWVQDAFDTAAAEGRTLIGDFSGATVDLDAIVTIPSGLRYEGAGTKFRRVLAAWQSPTFRSAGWTSGAYISDVDLIGLEILETDSTGFGSFLVMRCDRLLLDRPRFKKLGANWTTMLSGDDIRIINPYIDCYDATLSGSAPEGYQTWCDALHFNVCNNVVISNPIIRSQDDCIAFTYDDAPWVGMLPRPGDLTTGISRNIVVNGGILKSKDANWIRIGTFSAEEEVATNASYKNVRIGNFIGIVNEASPARQLGSIILDDVRPDATEKHDEIVLHDISVVANSTDAEIFFIRGNPESYSGTSIKNFGRVSIENVKGLSSENSSGIVGLIEGVEELILSGVSTRPSGAQSSANGLAIKNVSKITLVNSELRANTTGNACAMERYDSLVLGPGLVIGGDTDDTGGDEFSALSLAPNSGAALRIPGLLLADAARAIALTGSHGIIYPDGKLETNNITFDSSIPDVVKAATGRWISYTPVCTATGSALSSYTASGRYRYVGPKTVEVSMVITPVGGTGTIEATLPVGVNSTVRALLLGKDDGAHGQMLVGRGFPSSSVVTITKYDNTYPAGSGSILTLTGTYETV